MMADYLTRLSISSTPSNALDHVVVRLRLIGQMEAWTIRSESVLPAGRKTRALLASIAMAAPRPGAVGIDVEEGMRATAVQPASLALLDGDLLEDLDGVDPNFDAWLITE